VHWVRNLIVWSTEGHEEADRKMGDRKVVLGTDEVPALPSFRASGMRMIRGWSILMAWCATSLAAEPDNATWPMLAHDAARSGATAAEIRPPFARQWYRLFPDEGLMSGVQPVVADGCVYVGTLAGVVHAIDAETGRDRWTFRAPGAVLHACAADGGKVFLGCADGKVYALRTSDGTLAWTVPTGAAVWNAPAVHAGTVFVGSRDGCLYAIDAEDGTLRWTATTEGPLLCSPTVDAKAGRVYVGSEDMHVYALALDDGRQIWRSAKLPGVSLRGYHPVVARDGAVLVTVTPAASLDRMASVLLEMVQEVFGDFASWRHSKEENARLREANFELLKKPETYPRQMEFLRRRLQDEPALQTFFVLDPATGKQRFVTPIVYSESMNGTGAPAVVVPDGRVVVKFQALLRSRYEHYSPFLNVGYLDTATGEITPIMDQSRTYGWHDSLLLVHDEQCQLSVAGRVLINTHQDNVNALDLDTLRGYGEPFCRNIHEPKPGEAVGIWTHVLRGTPLPVGKEWLARGTVVYGGGSVCDVPVAVAGDSFYFIPTHEMNAGVALIAYRMQADGRAQESIPPPADKLTEAEWSAVQQRPWDWDTLGMPRLDHVLQALPGTVPGTRQRPLTEEAAQAVAKIADAELDRLVWEAASVHGVAGTADAALAQALTRSVQELIQQSWRPLVFPSGKHPEEAYRFFGDPTETLSALARAYPHVDANLQPAIQQFVAEWSSGDGPLASPTGQRTLPADGGQVRSAYDVPERLLRVADDFGRTEVARLYPLWRWAHASGDWSKLERDWPQLRPLLDSPPNALEEDYRNGYVAGLIAYCRIAHRVRDQDAAQRGLIVGRRALRERLEYEFAHTNGGLITRAPVGRSIFGRWRHLTPEVGRLLQTYAEPTQRHLMAVYVDHHRPTWWLAWNVELMLRNESPFSLPTMSAEIFDARALVLREPQKQLAAYLDLPWCRADLSYLQKLAACLEANRELTWEDVRGGS
jgi:outer membrane protein assembly factor BamB